MNSKTILDNYWPMRLKTLAKTLEENRFAVDIVSNLTDAKDLVLSKILLAEAPKTIGLGGSLTIKESGLIEELTNRTELKIINPPPQAEQNPEEIFEQRRQSLLADMFFTGSNAITEHGVLVNLDGLGNRVAALAFGPKKVILFVGRNKIVTSLNEAQARIKALAAPANTQRLQYKNPCLVTSACTDCKSQARICNAWLLTEKSNPKGRIHIVLINQDIGL